MYRDGARDNGARVGSGGAVTCWELRQRGTRGLVMEDIGAEVHPIRPSNCSRFRVHAHLAKHVDLFKGSKHATATNDSLAKINLTTRTVAEVPLDNIVPNMADRFHSHGHRG